MEKNFRLLICSFFVVILIYIAIYRPIKKHELFPSVYSQSQIVYDFNISFVETNENASELHLKQLCALESAAKHNPNAKVYLYTICKKTNIGKVTQYYPNIEMVIMDLKTIFIGTPLEKWWNSGKLHKFHPLIRILHFSDAVRLLLLYNNGGVYTDLDVYALDSYEDLVQHDSLCLYKNIGEIDFNNAFLTALKNSPFYYAAMEYYARTYNQYGWADNGPILMRNHTLEYCNLQFNQLRDSLLVGDKSINNPVSTLSFEYPEDNACKFYLLPSYVAFPYFWKESKELFQPNATISVNRYLYSRAVHTSTTTSQGLDIGENKSQIDFICRFNCPKTYRTIIQP